MASLFDSADGSSGSENSRSQVFRDDESDEETAFTVATVLEKRKRSSDGSRRDTITRIMPTICINDKYTIPTTIEKKQIDDRELDERTQLRITSSLMDDSSDSENEEGGYRRESGGRLSNLAFANSFNREENIFRTPSQDYQIDISSKSTAVRRNSTAAYASRRTNLLDEEVRTSVSSGKNKETYRRSSSETFMSVYEDLGSKTRTPADPWVEELGTNYAAAKRSQVKTLVKTALRSVVDGLAAHATSNTCDGVSSWDTSKMKQMSGKKRDHIDKSSHIPNTRRKSLNLRSELILVQDMVQEKTEECERLMRKLEESQSQMKLLQNENSILLQSKVILESKIEILREDTSATNASVKSLASQLKESQSKIEELELDLEAERENNNANARAAKQLEAALKRTKQEKRDAEKEWKSLKSRADLQDEVVRMRNALKDIRKLESVRSENTRRIEAELRDAHSALAKAHSEVETFSIENKRLLAQLKQTKSPGGGHLSQLKMEWEEGAGGIEISTAREQQNAVATPNTTNLENINVLGAEDVGNGSELFDHGCKLPVKTILRGTPSSSSRQLTFTSTSKIQPEGKENSCNMSMNAPQAECSLCFHPLGPNEVIKRCQCGKKECNMWAHSVCLANKKSVSNCVSHPGTPAPPPPTILCSRIWAKK